MKKFDWNGIIFGVLLSTGAFVYSIELKFKNLWRKILKKVLNKNNAIDRILEINTEYEKIMKGGIKHGHMHTIADCVNSKKKKPAKKKYRSNAEWYPESGCKDIYGRCRSSDTHDTIKASMCVCDALERDGYGGEGEHFPIKTWVEAIKVKE